MFYNAWAKKAFAKQGAKRMSLIKQLWIAVVLLMTLAFSVSFFVSTYSAKHYLAQQLQLKNHDNASSLALSMSQMEKDPVTVELLLAAQFDTGHYQRIRLSDPHGKVIVERHYRGQDDDGAPEWFIRLTPLDATPGMAQVQDGWRQYGTLLVESHSRFAYAALWDGTKRLLQWFLFAAIAGGIIGTWILKTITQPLDGVVAQAEAIGNRRFITADEPRTLEFRALARAMNALSERVKNMLEKEAHKLDDYRRENQHDKVTGLANREHFLNLIDSAFSSPENAANGVLILARITNLSDVNRVLGHQETDALLGKIAGKIGEFTSERVNAFAGRTRNSDFAILLPGAHDPEADTMQLAGQLHQLISEVSSEIQIAMPVAAAGYNPGDERSKVLARADGALASAEQKGNRHVEIQRDSSPVAHSNMDGWRQAINSALDHEGIKLDRYPVIDPVRNIIHMEAPARLHMDGMVRNAGYFMPWAERLGLMPRIDLDVAREAISTLSKEPLSLGINLSEEALSDAWFRGELYKLLADAREQAQRLWIELPEAAVLRNLSEFKALCLALHPIGCKIGLDHVGSGFGRIAELHDLGLDYIKVDTSVIRDIDHNAANQTFLRGLTTIAHSIGLQVYAEGVKSEEERAYLDSIGIDGMTGPLIRI